MQVTHMHKTGPQKVERQLASLRKSRPTLGISQVKRKMLEKSFESPCKRTKRIRTEVSPSFHKEVICKASPNTQAIWMAKHASPSNPCKIARYSRGENPYQEEMNHGSMKCHPIHEMMGTRTQSPPIIQEEYQEEESLGSILDSLEQILGQWDPCPVIRVVQKNF